MGKKLWYTCVEILEEFKISNIDIAQLLKKRAYKFLSCINEFT